MQAPDIDVREEHQRIAAFFEKAEEMLGLPDSVLYHVEETVSGWSPAQHLFHIFAANGMMLKGVQLIHRGGGPVTEKGEPNRAGYIALARERFPRGKVQAPDRVRPDDRPDRDTLTASLARSRAKLTDVEGLLPSLSEKTERLPHPFLGALNASEWLRVVRIHSEHHLQIIREITASPTSA